MDEVEWGHFPCHNPIRYPYFETTLGNLMLHKSTKTHVIRSLLGHIEDEAQRLVGKDHLKRMAQEFGLIITKNPTFQLQSYDIANNMRFENLKRACGLKEEKLNNVDFSARSEKNENGPSVHLYKLSGPNLRVFRMM
ncbi:unnamed protein product [Sphenostylis stenocarpa]|uniref:Uncharacterized protein n=1 Tax=Sphenostylis stenocarpa TaxID=92480 RepID=A0AA86VI14_9FABA|nr:unnamed protein product [Sphenostylis stenocarpa]